MESLTFHLRHGYEETIESWDDDGDLQCYEDIQLRTASSATSATNSSIRRSGHRDSISSRRSARSDLESAAGDEDWQVQLLDNEEALNEEAIASAKSAGIPLPANVPKSALVGGTIKRLGRRKTKHNYVDDWSEDVEFPDSDAILELKSHTATFPESLQQIGSAAASPVKNSASACWGDDSAVRPQPSWAHMERYQKDESGDVEDISTIKATRPRSPQRANIVNRTTSDKESNVASVSEENFEEDFDLPPENLIRLSPLKANAGTQSPSLEDFDMEWSEGSIGVRFGGTTRDHRSNPSSSVSVVSPSASSCLTGESEDEGLDGLVIPEGPLDLAMSMQKRLRPSTAAVKSPEPKQVNQDAADSEDFFSGLELESADIFDTRRLSINPNVKCKTDSGGPSRRSATTLTFKNTIVSPKTRIPRLSNHDRQHSTHLETVSESGAPLSKFRTSLPKTSCHSSHSSMSGISPHGASLATSSSLSPGRRSGAGARLLRDSSSNERTVAGRQLLKPKRSLPTIRNSSLTGSASQLQSPRQDMMGCSASSNSRPRTPVDRVGNDARLLGRRLQAPFIPAGASEHQSHHASVKSHRHTRRTNSESLQEAVASQGQASRLPRPGRYETLEHDAHDSGTLVAAAKRTLTRPTRRRNFGDGTELASFDDLPTSSTAESKFVKHPSGRGAPRSLKNKLGRSQTIPWRSEVQQPVLATPFKLYDSTPRFARDTNASRNAREQRIASMTSSSKNRENSALVSLSSNWKPQAISRVPTTPLPIRSKRSRTATTPGSKPQLIKPLGSGVQERKSVNGMRYNPATFRWEGNESLAQDFDTDSPQSPKPAPALITNVGAMQNVQVVGGMVFDPQRMCWLKLAPLQPGTRGLVAVQDEDDVFAGLSNLEEKSGGSMPLPSGVYDDIGPVVSGDDRSCGDSSDEWPITEEFDVGPEFIRRQRAEEEKWRRKVNKWTDFDRRKFGDSWRWAIRDLVGFNSTLSVQGLGGN